MKTGSSNESSNGSIMSKSIDMDEIMGVAFSDLENMPVQFFPDEVLTIDFCMPTSPNPPKYPPHIQAAVRIK